MMKFISSRYVSSAATPMGQTDYLANSYEDLIDLSIGDMNLTTDKQVIKEAFADASAGYTKYSPCSGDPMLKDAIAAMYREDYGIELNANEIFISASGCIAMYLILEAVLNDGDEVLMHSPYFVPYYQQIELARGVPVEVPTFEKDGFELDSKVLESFITPKTKALILNSPNNPTGAHFSESTLDAIGKIAEKHDILIICDEVYGAFCYKNAFKPFISRNHLRNRTVTINSFSKNFVMTGWRIGNIIANPDITRVIQMINENLVYTAPTISQRAAIHAIKGRQRIYDAVQKEYKGKMEYACKEINKIPGLSILNPAGTFYLFINIKGSGLSSADFCDLLLKEAHILAIPGNAFGQAGEGYIRAACNVDTKTLDEAFARIKKLSILKNL